MALDISETSLLSEAWLVVEQCLTRLVIHPSRRVQLLCTARLGFLPAGRDQGFGHL